MKSEAEKAGGGAVASSELLACVWTQSCDGGEWQTDCGKAFVVDNDSPSENGMKFCCFCGKPLKEEVFKESDDDEQANTKGQP